MPNYEDIEFDTAAYHLAEWYATLLDMASALAWLKNDTGMNQPAHPLPAVLAVDSKPPHDEKTWPSVGCKGGFEDQLLAGNWLLQNKNGHGYTLHVFYHNPHGKADQQAMLEAGGTIFAAIERAIE